jgi:uncharacterized protein DUF4389
VNEHPIRLVVSDDLRRSRLTVFFRALLALPHMVWIALWTLLVLLAGIVNWLATLLAGRSPAPLHNFLAAYVRYTVHLGAYLFLAGNPFPGFTGKPGYPIDVRIAPPERQNRWKVFFRSLLALPAMIFASALISSGYGTGNIGLLATAALLGWFAALARGSMPRGLRDAMTYALSYGAQLHAYLLLLTDRYPNSDPQAALESLPVRSDPVSLENGDDLRRSRLTVFFRALLALVHLLWLSLWGVAVFVVWIVNWFATLFAARSPESLHRFLAAYLRYQAHVYAYLLLLANPFPGFLGESGSYPVEVRIAPPERQNRWKVFFRLALALPAMLLSSAYSNVILLVAVLGWFASLVTARMPLGLRNAGTLALRYSTQVNGYLLLLTDSYPYSGPTAVAPAGLAGSQDPFA